MIWMQGWRAARDQKPGRTANTWKEPAGGDSKGSCHTREPGTTEFNGSKCKVLHRGQENQRWLGDDRLSITTAEAAEGVGGSQIRRDVSQQGNAVTRTAISGCVHRSAHVRHGR